MASSVNGSLPISQLDALYAKTLIAFKYMDAAMLVYLVADYLQTVEDEIRYIWAPEPTGSHLLGSKRRHWWRRYGLSGMKILFFLNRYLPFVDVSAMVLQAQGWNVTPTLLGYGGCSKNAILFVYVSAAFGTAIAEAIMSIRVYALSKGTRWTAIWLCLQFSLVQAVCLALTVYNASLWAPFPNVPVLDRVEGYPRSYTGDPFRTFDAGYICSHLFVRESSKTGSMFVDFGLRLQLDFGISRYYPNPSNAPSTTWNPWFTVDQPYFLFLITLVNHIVVTSLGFYFLYKNFRIDRGPLVRTMWNQGLVYFAVMTVVDCSCLVLLSKPGFWTAVVEKGPTLGATFITVLRTVRATLTSRIVIDIRRVSKRTTTESGDNSSSDVRTLSMLQFKNTRGPTNSSLHV